MTLIGVIKKKRNGWIRVDNPYILEYDSEEDTAVPYVRIVNFPWGCEPFIDLNSSKVEYISKASTSLASTYIKNLTRKEFSSNEDNVSIDDETDDDDLTEEEIEANRFQAFKNLTNPTEH